MNNSSKLYFQFAVENVRKTLDAQKGEIEKWAKDNPILLEVRFRNLKSQLEQLGAVFGKDNSQLVNLGKEIDNVFGNARKGAKGAVQDMSKMTTAAREIAEINSKLESSANAYNAALEKESSLKARIASEEERIAAMREKMAKMKTEPDHWKPASPGDKVSFSRNGTDYTAVYDTQGIKSYEKSIQDATQKVKELKSQLNSVVEERKRLAASIEKDKGTKEQLQELTQRVTTQQKYNYILADTEKLLERINNAISKGGNRNLLDVAARDVIAFQNKAVGLSKYKDEASVVANLTGEFNRLSKVYGTVVSEQEKMVKANETANIALSSQSQILSDLKTMALQYLSVWGAKTFIDNIIEQGGQLEQQRLSIGAILQDTAHANELFGKIKSLAIISPFGVTELDAMTKQLSAYGFKYNELYDMTKRLADISAATGTEVSRLALALGHVRSEGALSGYTLRQFSMGNIPLLEKLSQKIGVTAKEIRKMVSKKEIGYDQVLEVMKELTDEGGMFYNAQEVMSQALNAKFKNLRDSFQIMYSEMAEGAPGDFLKGIAETLTTLSKNWKVLMPMIIAAGSAVGMQKAFTMALNYELTREGFLTNKATASKAKYTAATQAAITATGRWTLALRGAGRALASMGKFLISPWTLGFAAVEGLIYMWQKHNREIERAKELTEGFRLSGSEGERNLTERMTGIDPYKKGMSESELKQGIDTMTQALKDYGKGLNVAKTLQEAFGSDETTGKVKSLAEQYEFLRRKVEDTLDVYKELQRTADSFEFGINFSSAWWGDENVETDLTDYANAVKKFEDAVTSLTVSHKDEVKAAVEAAQKRSEAYREATKDMKSYSEMLKELYVNNEKYDHALGYARGVFAENGLASSEGKVYGSFYKIQAQKNEAMSELEEFMKGVEEKLGYDMKNLSEKQVNNLLKQTHDWIDKHPEWNSIIDDIKNKIEVRWPIKLEPETEDTPKELNEWQKQMQDWLDKHGSKLKIKPDMTRDDIVKLVHQSIKDTQTVIDQTKPILLRFGVDLSNIPEELPIGLRTPWGKKQAADYTPAANENKTDKDFIKEFGLPSPKEKGSGRKEDKEAKKLRERVRILKEAADSYQYWRQKVGDAAAESRMQGEFGQLLKEQNLEIKNADELRAKLQALREEYSKKPQTKAMVEAIKEIDKELAQLERKDFEKRVDKYVSQLTRDIDELTQKWEIFNSVLEQTGDRALAQRLTGITPGATPADLKRLNVSSFAGTKIDFDSVVNMSDEEIDRYVEGLGIAEDKIKAVQDGLKDWKKAEKDVYKSDIQNYAKWLGGLVDIENLRKKNQEEYNTILEETIRLMEKYKKTGGKEGISEQEGNRRIASAGIAKDTKDWHNSTLYKNLYGNALGMVQEDFAKAYKAELENLQAQFDAGAITASEYTEKVEGLNKIEKEFSDQGMFGLKGGVGAFLKGGNLGLAQYYRSRAQYLRSTSTQSGDEEDLEAQEYEKKAGNLEKQQRAVDDVVAAFQDLATIADMLGDIFDSLGNSTASSAMGNLSDMLGGAAQGASSLSFAGPWGMAAGAALGVTSSFLQLYDKGLQKQIDAIKNETDALEANTNAIKKSRERMLGYDTGSLRKRFAGLYTDETWSKTWNPWGDTKEVENYATAAMQDYYERNSSGTGYKQELANLKDEREKYIEMYNLEADKKKSSQEALDEYRSKIAELDDQITYFVEDLANELWGVDFKEWASQISDALWTAFENGEDAVKAFRETAKDIMSDVAKRMMNLHFIEPAFQALEDELFGKIDSNGNRVGGVAYNNTTGELDENAVLKILGEYLGEGGYMERQIEGAQKFYELAQKVTGFDFSSEDSSSSTGSSIKGITEQTADLLASYVNACRASTAQIQEMTVQYFPMYYAAMTRGNTSLANIENHTSAIMLSNERIASRIENLDNNIIGLKNHVWRVPMA